MPQIIVTAENPRADGERAVMFTERVSSSDFESGHFQAQLVERLNWAVEDADALEQDRTQLPDGTEPPQLEPAEDVQQEQLAAAEEQRQLESASTPTVLAHSTN